MSKAKTKKKAAPVVEVVQNSHDPMFYPEPKALGQIMRENGLADVLFGNGSGIGVNPCATQLTQVDTLEKNLRYYFVSNMRPLLSEAYVEVGLIQTICDVPCQDAMRGGYDIKTKMLSPKQIEALQGRAEEIGLDVDVCQASIWTRLYGGGGLVCITGEDPEKEMDPANLVGQSRFGFRAVDMWELFYGTMQTAQFNGNPANGLSLDPLADKPEFFNFYGMKVHSSRVNIMKGKEAPSFVRPRLQGWGFSVVETLITSINQYLKNNNLTFEVLDEFKLDVYKFQGLVQTLMSKDGEGKIRQRAALANKQKNYQNAIILDSGDEFDHKQLSFAGLAEVMDGVRTQVASDMRMPKSKLFGEPASGLNASNEGDLEVYNAMVESEVRGKMKRPHIRALKLLAAHMFGVLPEDLTINYRPLRMLTAEQEENVKNSKFNRLMTASSQGAATPKEVSEGINRDNLLPVQVKPGTGPASLGEGEEDREEPTEE